MADHYEKNHAALAHEIWAAAQLAPGEGIVDGVARVEALLLKRPHPAITFCDNCGCNWLDDGLSPIGCPYCKQSTKIERLEKTLGAYQAAVNKIDDLIEYSLPMPPETKAALYAVLANLTATLAKELTND